jgi:hypothetical protein
MADALRSERQSRAGRQRVFDDGAQLADARLQHGDLHERGARSESAGGVRASLGDAASARCGLRPYAARPGWAIRHEARRAGSCGRRADVGRALGARLEVGRSYAEPGAFPSAWPPGPSGDWSALAVSHPDLIPATRTPEPRTERGGGEAESTLRRVADGTAPRVDRLRCLGNAVVPVVAAYAFRSLAEAMNNDDF